MEENFRFICEECNYMTHDKSNYNKHFKTNKHLNKLKGALTDENKIYKCKGCNKKFNNRTSLWRHNKKCFIDKDFEESDSEYNTLSDDDEYENMDEEYDDKEYDDISETDCENNYESESDDEFEEERKQGSAKGLQKIIKMLIKENSEFKDTIMMQQQQQNETNKIMMELVKSNTNGTPNSTPTSVTTTTTNGITNGNNNVNNLVIIFLNHFHTFINILLKKPNAFFALSFIKVHPLPTNFFICFVIFFIPFFTKLNADFANFFIPLNALFILLLTAFPAFFIAPDTVFHTF